MKVLILGLFLLSSTLFASPLNGACEKFHNSEMNDGSDYNAAISRFLVVPLHNVEMSDYALRLEVAAIIEGSGVRDKHCQAIDILDSCLDAVQIIDKGDYDNGREYFETIKGLVIFPLEEAGYNDEALYYSRILDPLETYSSALSLKTCQEISKILKV